MGSGRMPTVGGVITCKVTAIILAAVVAISSLPVDGGLHVIDMLVEIASSRYVRLAVETSPFNPTTTPTSATLKPASTSTIGMFDSGCWSCTICGAMSTTNATNPANISAKLKRRITMPARMTGIALDRMLISTSYLCYRFTNYVGVRRGYHVTSNEDNGPVVRQARREMPRPLAQSADQ